MKLNVSNIQHFSTGDGDGIRTTLFLKGCNLRCPWCHNPETVSPAPEELFFRANGKRMTYGREMTVEELLPELLEDTEFYRASGGGVTVSGGEPLLQNHAVAALAKELKARGVSVIIDTAGDVPYASFERVLPYVDEIFLDIKSGSEAVYRDIIGGSLSRVYENLTLLLAKGANVQVRIPLIPDINTAPQAVEEIILLLRKAGVGAVDLLPFHRMGSAKYEALGKEYAYRDTKPLSRECVAAIAQEYGKYFTVTVEK